MFVNYLILVGMNIQGMLYIFYYDRFNLHAVSGIISGLFEGGNIDCKVNLLDSDSSRVSGKIIIKSIMRSPILVSLVFGNPYPTNFLVP